MPDSNKELAAEHAARAATQAQHAASNVAEAIGYEKDVVVQKAKGLALELRITNTPLAILTVIAITGGTALAIRGGRDVFAELKARRADRLERKQAEELIP